MDKAIVLVFFGTTIQEGKKQIEDLEKEIKDKYRCKVITTFSSKKIRGKMNSKYSIKILTLQEILFNLANEYIKDVIIQPVYFTANKDIDEILEIAGEYKYSFSRIVIGTSLVNQDILNEEVIDTIKNILPKDKEILLIAHGKKNSKNNIYRYLEKELNIGRQNKVYIGMLEGEYDKDTTILRLLEDKVKKIELRPLLITLGYHVVNDIFSKEQSWENSLKKRDIIVTSVKQSLLDSIDIRRIFINKIDKSMKNIIKG